LFLSVLVTVRSAPAWGWAALWASGAAAATDAPHFIEPVLGFHSPFGSLVHLVGALVFAALTIPLVRATSGAGRRVAVAGFGLAAVTMLSLSGTYHMLSSPVGQRVLQRLDHAAIYLLIAGTLTPVLVLLFRGVARWLPLGLTWFFAATVISLRSVFFEDLPSWGGMTSYLVFGWVGAFIGVSLWRQHGWRFVRLLVFGGVAYTLGTVLFAFDEVELVPSVIGLHEVWHIAVLIGLSLHWRFVRRVVVPRANAS
jgi:channel protein (hemolysin III family)